MTSHRYAPLIASCASAKKSAVEQKIEQILALGQSNLQKSLLQIQALNWNKYNKTIYTHSFFAQACELWEEKSLSKNAVSQLFETALDNGWDPYQDWGVEKAVEDQSQQNANAAKRSRKRVELIAPIISLSSKNMMYNSFIEFLFSSLDFPDKAAIKMAQKQENFITQVQKSKQILSFLWGRRWENNLRNAKEEKILFEYHTWLIQLGVPIPQKFINQMRSGLKDLSAECWWDKSHHKKACDLLEQAIAQREKTNIMNSIKKSNKTPSAKKTARKM